ncbi:MAG TPA: AAA family ATPase [Deinococcales bacterium]|nr:AAA family ATPase [Deinococcales bacterium]
MSDGIERVHAATDRLEKALSRVLIGQESVVEALVAVALASGHALLEGVPGLGKTWLAQNFARAAGLEYRRIQFTPDLMPADVTGTQVIDTAGGGLHFRFQKGPIFASLLLADEINRATPKTQSSLLEAMQEGGVTVAGERHELPRPFMVIATQNPLEMEGTYPLPEAQLDRFLAKIEVGRPGPDTLRKVLEAGVIAPANETLATGDLLDMREITRSVPVSSPVLDYITRLTEATHKHPSVRYGLSPRGAQALLALARAFALMDARPFVSADDVRKAAPLAAHHRLILNFEAELEGVSPAEVLKSTLESVKA